VGRPDALDLGVRRGDPIAVAHPRAAQLASLLSVSARVLEEGRSGGEQRRGCHGGEERGDRDSPCCGGDGLGVGQRHNGLGSGRRSKAPLECALGHQPDRERARH
jgi:hypothetical protein